MSRLYSLVVAGERAALADPVVAHVFLRAGVIIAAALDVVYVGAARGQPADVVGAVNLIAAAGGAAGNAQAARRAANQLPTASHAVCRISRR